MASNGFPPPDQRPNDTRVPLVFGVEITLLTLVTIVMVLRFYARTYVKKTVGADDWVMAVAALFAVIGGVIHMVSTQYGTGHHIWNVKKEHYLINSKLAYVYVVMFTPALVLAKLSICMKYLRVFPERSNIIFCYCTMAFLLASGIGCTLALMLPCQPVHASWNRMGINDKRCVNLRVLYTITTTLNTTSDFLVFLWPAPRLWKVDIPTKQRLGLIFVFSIGLLTCAAGVIRIYYIAAVYFANNDLFYNMATLYILSSLDANLGILCGSLPEIRPLLWGYTSRAVRSVSDKYATHASRSRPDRSSTYRPVGTGLETNTLSEGLKETSSDSEKARSSWLMVSQEPPAAHIEKRYPKSSSPIPNPLAGNPVNYVRPQSSPKAPPSTTNPPPVANFSRPWQPREPPRAPPTPTRHGRTPPPLQDNSWEAQYEQQQRVYGRTSPTERYHDQRKSPTSWEEQYEQQRRASEEWQRKSEDLKRKHQRMNLIGQRKNISHFED